MVAQCWNVHQCLLIQVGLEYPAVVDDELPQLLYRGFGMSVDLCSRHEHGIVKIFDITHVYRDTLEHQPRSNPLVQLRVLYLQFGSFPAHVLAKVTKVRRAVYVFSQITIVVSLQSIESGIRLRVTIADVSRVLCVRWWLHRQSVCILTGSRRRRIVKTDIARNVGKDGEVDVMSRSFRGRWVVRANRGHRRSIRETASFTRLRARGTIPAKVEFVLIMKCIRVCGLIEL